MGALSVRRESDLEVKKVGVIFQASSPRHSNVCQLLNQVQLFVTPCTVACQAPLSMGFPRPEYWSGQPFLSPGDLSDPGIEPRFSALQADSLKSEPPGKPRHSGVASFPFPSCPFPDGEGLEWVILWSRAGGGE